MGVDPPEWVRVLGAVDVNSMSAGELTLEVTEGPFFIACFDGTPGIGPDKRLAILRPVEVAPQRRRAGFWNRWSRWRSKM